MKYGSVAPETYHIIQVMKAMGNSPGLIERWKSEVADWAQMNRTDPNAAAVNAWLPLWQPRPLYTTEELAPIWPALAIVTGYTRFWPSVPKSVKRLENELDFHRLPYVMIDGKKYYVVERLHFWKNASEEELKNALA